MAFTPLHGRIIAEECLDEAGFTITGDILVDGTVRIAPVIEYKEVNEWGFDKVTWDHVQLIDSGQQLLDDGWATGEDYVLIGEFDYVGWYQLDVNWPHDYAYIAGAEQIPTGEGGVWGTGEVHTLAYSGEDWNQVDNTDGWTAEVTFFVPIYPDEWLYPYHKEPWGRSTILTQAQGGYWYIDFDDGTKKGRIWVDPWSTLFVPSEHEKKVRELQLGISGDTYAIVPPKFYTEYTLYPRTLRLTVKGDEVWITTNTGVKGSTSYSSTGTSSISPDGTVHIGSIAQIGGDADTPARTIGAPSPTDPVKATPTNTYPEPGSPTGLPNGSVYGPDGAVGFYYNGDRFSPAPPSQRVPVDPQNEQYTFHADGVGLATSGGTKSFSFNHSILGERVAGKGARASVLMIDSFKVDRAGYPIAPHNTYSGDYISFTPAAMPTYPVSVFDEVVYKSELVSNGETYITPQYYSGDWIDYGAPLQIVSGDHIVDLSGIPVNGDLADQVRFKIRQVAVEPSGEPPRVDLIQVMASPITGDFSVSPSFGTTTGGNWVTLSWLGGGGSFAGGQQVWVGGVQVSASDIVHVDADTKKVLMPAKAVGAYHLKVVGSTFWSLGPYTYVESYDVDTDVGYGTIPTGELELVFGNTRSPFRVLTRPPDHSVNLALMGATPMSIGTHMSLVGLSDLEPANLTGFGVQDTHLYNGVSGDFDFTNAVDTADVLLSNKAAMWRDVAAPAPLFYKYLLGRDRYYLYVPEASSVEDLETIRAALTLFEDAGASPSFQWDIEVSDRDYADEALPLGVYAVVILTDRIATNTMWASYRGIDRLTGYDSQGTRREIINPVPLFDTGTDRMEFRVDSTPAGSYNVNIEV